MNIYVCVHRVLDCSVPLLIDETAMTVTQLESESVHLLDNADRCALEAALGIAEAAGHANVIAITAGVAADEEVLRYCLARGASHAIRIAIDKEQSVDAFQAATLLGEVIAAGNPGLVLCGDRSSDWGSGQVPAALAERLGMPQLTRIVSAGLNEAGDGVRVQRRVERGTRQLVEASLPCLMTVSAGTFAVRYVSIAALRRVVQAIETVIPDGLDIAASAENPKHALMKRSALTPPRPRTKKTIAPAATGGNMMAMMMGGGASAAAPKKSGGLVQGSPETVADAIVRFLDENDFLRGHSDQ